MKEYLYKIISERAHFENFEVRVDFSGNRVILSLNARQLVNESSQEQLVLLAFHDITDQKIFNEKLEKQVEVRTQELHDANMELLHSNENLNQFASIASHDLQEPLRKIQTYTSLLEKRFSEALSNEGKEVVQKIRLSSLHMSQLIKEVLEYSKIGHSEKKFVPSDLDMILKAVLYDLEMLIVETGAVIHYPAPLAVLQAMPLQIHQLFYNLLSNALKFRKPGLEPVITLSSHALPLAEYDKYPGLTVNKTYLEIVFSDNGIGFEQQFSEQIFQIFERLHSVGEYEGTGIGLALCKKIVENHHGHIFALSKENKGSAFHIILPISQ